jgi:hypothetical protein
MGLSCAVGSFAVSTTVGSQADTGVGFAPKVVLFFTVGEQMADGISATRSGLEHGLWHLRIRIVGARALEASVNPTSIPPGASRTTSSH